MTPAEKKAFKSICESMDSANLTELRNDLAHFALRSKGAEKRFAETLYTIAIDTDDEGDDE